MFHFRKILSLSFNHTTGKTTSAFYHIVAARLASDDGLYNDTPGESNMFEIDLEPVGNDCDNSICGLTIVVGNSGDWVRVQRDLNPDAGHESEPGRFELDMVDAQIEKDTLVLLTCDAESEDLSNE